MKKMLIIAAGLFLALPAGGASARHSVCHQTPGTYVNVNGREVHRPVCSRRHIKGATARCRDGSESFSRHARGTCSRHGGVARWER